MHYTLHVIVILIDNTWFTEIGGRGLLQVKLKEIGYLCKDTKEEHWCKLKIRTYWMSRKLNINIEII